MAEGLVMPLARRGVTPNTVTVIGFLFNVITAAVLASGHLSAGGAFLDSLLDRYSEAMILLALIYIFTVRANTPAVLLVYAVAVGSILISYARARAEGLGLDGKVGIAPRPERVLILGLGLLFNGLTTIAALAVLAVLTHATAMQRLYHVWRQTHSPSGRQSRPAAKQRETAP